MLLWQPLKNEGEDTKKNKLIHCFYVEIVKCFVFDALVAEDIALRFFEGLFDLDRLVIFIKLRTRIV